LQILSTVFCRTYYLDSPKGRLSASPIVPRLQITSEQGCGLGLEAYTEAYQRLASERLTNASVSVWKVSCTSSKTQCSRLTVTCTWRSHCEGTVSEGHTLSCRKRQCTCRRSAATVGHRCQTVGEIRRLRNAKTAVYEHTL